MNVKNMCILAGALLFAAGAVQAQSPMFCGENNQNFAEEIQPGLLEQAADIRTAPFDYMLITKRLGIYGTPAAAPVLALELPNPAKSESARNALEEMPYPEALAELRFAAEYVTDPVLKAGIFDSLGMRRDRDSVQLLMGYLNDENLILADAACFALARIADPAYKDALTAKMTEGSDTAKQKGSDLALMYGDFLRRDGNEADAIAVFRAVQQNGFADFHREAAVYQILLNEAAADPDEMYEWLTGSDEVFYRGTIRAVQYLSEDKIGETLVRAYPNLTDSRKPAAAAALVRWQTSEARNVVVEALSSADPELRDAAIGAFQGGADRETILKFADAVIAGDDALKARAAGVYAGLGENADSVFLELLNGDDAHQIQGAAAAAVRKIFAARDRIAEMTKSDSPELRDAGLAALGAVADIEAFQLLAETYLETGAPAALDGLKRACGTVGDKDAAALILEKADADLAGKEKRAPIFDCYVRIGGSAALAAVQKAALSNDKISRDLATKALGNWMSIDAADILLKLSETKGYPYANRTLRGLLRLAKQFQMEDTQRLEILKKAEVSPAGDNETQKLIETIAKQYKLEL